MGKTKVVPFSGARLRRWREARGWSQEQFASAFKQAGGRDVSTMTVSNWERGKQLPRQGEVELIATALGVDVDDLGSTD